MTAEQGSHFFSGAVRPKIANSTFTSVSGDYNTHNYAPKSERYGLRLLLDNIAKGAFHDAAERGDPPKCHPHTRLAIRVEIMEWIKLPEARSKLIRWMYGPAGSGKTAIGQSIAEECKELGLLAASFFFSRTAIRARCNDTTQVAATIAYQISCFFPEVKDLLFTAIEEDPTIFSRTLATQMQVLIIEPLKASPPSPKPIFVVLDGIDEIDSNHSSQADLLNVVGTAVSALKHVPLIFLIASRPEYEIREAFNGPLLSSLTKSLVLDDKYKPDSDIRLYFDSTFQNMRDKHLRLGVRLPSPWPSESNIVQLVQKASGQFIFAATVTKFIDSVRHHPPDQLNIILGLSATGNETPFALLDALYLHILSSVAPLQLPQVREILMRLIFGFNSDFHGRYFCVETVESLLCFDVRRALVDMHALLFVPPPTHDGSENDLRIYHASLEDFLTDRSRSHDFYIDTSDAHLTLTRHWSRALFNNQSSTFRLFYCIEGFTYHFSCLLASDMGEFMNDLAYFNLGQHLEDGACYSHELAEVRWEKFFECIQMQAGDRTDISPRLRDEYDAFILGIVSKYPPSLQAHIPTITIFANEDNLLQSDIFSILASGINPSVTKFQDSIDLDDRLLDLHEQEDFLPGFRLFQDCSRAGQYFVCDASYTALAKEIVGIIFPKLQEFSQQLRLEVVTDEISCLVRGSDNALCLRLHDPDLSWFHILLRKASTDLELARILHECALRYRSDAEFMEGWPNIARASLNYIQRCYSEYAHLLETDGTSTVNLGMPGSQSFALAQLSSMLKFYPCDGEIDNLPHDLLANSHIPFSYHATAAVSQLPLAHMYDNSHRYLPLPSPSATLPSAESPKSEQKRRAESPPGGHSSKRFKTGLSASIVNQAMPTIEQVADFTALFESEWTAPEFEYVYSTYHDPTSSLSYIDDANTNPDSHDQLNVLGQNGTQLEGFDEFNLDDF